MRLVRLVLLAVLVVGIAAEARVPHLVSQRVSTRPNCKPDEDPLGACQDVEVVLENPLSRPVIVTMWCGSVLEEENLLLHERQTLTATIEMNVPTSDERPCHIRSWRRL